MSTTLYVCATCRYSADEQDFHGQRGGVMLADELQLQLDEDSCSDLQLRRFECLMACNRHCTVHLRAPGKIGYVIGDFPPTTESAETLLDYARKYQQSDSGVVPYQTWPEAIKGHFVARMPPLDQDN